MHVYNGCINNLCVFFSCDEEEVDFLTRWGCHVRLSSQHCVPEASSKALFRPDIKMCPE